MTEEHVTAETQRDWQGVAGGLVLGLIGLLFAVNAPQYGIGTANRMQPGYFPFALGLLTAASGLIIAAMSWRSTGTRIEVSWRAAAAVLASVCVFALSVRSLGLAPAVFLVVLIACTGDRNAKPVSSLVLAVLTTLAAVLVFSWGLKLPVPVLRGIL